MIFFLRTNFTKALGKGEKIFDGYFAGICEACP
jgi:hypothetical protein